MKGFLELEDSVYCILGILPAERTTPQKVNWHLRFEFELPKKDSILETIDYIAVKELVCFIAKNGECNLIETLAQKILDALFKTFPVLSATLRVTKQKYRSTVEISR